MSTGRKKEQADNQKGQYGYAFFHGSLFMQAKISPAPAKTYEVHQPVFITFKMHATFTRPGTQPDDYLIKLAGAHIHY